MLIPFVQLEYAGRLGLADGRYLARPETGDEPDRVLVVQTLGAPHPASRSRRPRRRRARPVEAPAEPQTVPVTRATVTRGDSFEEGRAAAAWLRATADDREARVAEARAALAVLNRALDALREATGDPLVHEVGASEALAIRIGYGSGEQVADGVWSEARQLPPPPPKRTALDPQQQVAEALARREADDEEEG